jgi:hypothetical protein
MSNKNKPPGIVRLYEPAAMSVIETHFHHHPLPPK